MRRTYEYKSRCLKPKMSLNVRDLLFAKYRNLRITHLSQQYTLGIAFLYSNRDRIHWSFEGVFSSRAATSFLLRCARDRGLPNLLFLEAVSLASADALIIVNLWFFSKTAAHFSFWNLWFLYCKIYTWQCWSNNFSGTVNEIHNWVVSFWMLVLPIVCQCEICLQITSDIEETFIWRLWKLMVHTSVMSSKLLNKSFQTMDNS